MNHLEVTNSNYPATSSYQYPSVSYNNSDYASLKPFDGETLTENHQSCIGKALSSDVTTGAPIASLREQHAESQMTGGETQGVLHPIIHPKGNWSYSTPENLSSCSMSSENVNNITPSNIGGQYQSGEYQQQQSQYHSGSIQQQKETHSSTGNYNMNYTNNINHQIPSEQQQLQTAHLTQLILPSAAGTTAATSHQASYLATAPSSASQLPLGGYGYDQTSLGGMYSNCSSKRYKYYI